MTSRALEVTVGSQYYSATGYTYYGYDSGPNLYYGSMGSSSFVGTNNKEYTVHGVRWAAESPNNRVYLRLDNSAISSSQSYTIYKSLFTSIKIGSVTLNSADIVSGFTVTGGVAFYWNVSANPFGSVGSTTNLTFNGVEDGPFGIEIYGSDGTKTVISPATRYINAVGQLASFTLNPAGSAGDDFLVPADMTGLTASNSQLIIIASFDIAFVLDITREATGFRVTNPSSATVQCNALPIRF